MGVIINEFEVVAEPQSAQQKDTSQPDQQTPSQPSSHDVEMIIKHQMERFARVWAH
jgi:hypothetical protein